MNKKWFRHKTFRFPDGSALIYRPLWIEDFDADEWEELTEKNKKL